jgi:hypothetical protein
MFYIEGYLRYYWLLKLSQVMRVLLDYSTTVEVCILTELTESPHAYSNSLHPQRELHSKFHVHQWLPKLPFPSNQKVGISLELIIPTCGT